MSSPRFLLAKYVPNLSRMEPKNIGLIFWNNGVMRSRFVESNDADFIDEPLVFDGWVEFWNQTIATDFIHMPGREPIAKSDATCIDALASHRDGKFFLVDAGIVPQDVPAKDNDKAVDFLFGELVATSPTHEHKKASPSLSAQCDSLLSNVKLLPNDELIPRKAIDCTFKGITRSLHCDYFIGNGHPRAILQRANLTNEQQVNSAAWLVSSLTEQASISTDVCRILFRGSDVANESAEQGLRQLESLCPAIDIEEKSAKRSIEKLALAR